MIVTKSVQNMENIQNRRKIEKNAYMNEKTVVKKRSNEKWLQYKRLHIGNAQSLSNDLDADLTQRQATGVPLTEF